jgi:hypothetical protein
MTSSRAARRQYASPHPAVVGRSWGGPRGRFLSYVYISREMPGQAAPLVLACSASPCASSLQTRFERPARQVAATWFRWSIPPHSQKSDPLNTVRLLLGTKPSSGYSPRDSPIVVAQNGARGRHFRGRRALYSHLRFVTVATLISFASVIGIGVPALLSSAEKVLVTRVEVSERPATACEQHTWLQFDRSCLPRRGLPWIAGHGRSTAVPVEVASATANLPEQPLTESQQTATLPRESLLQESIPEESMPQQPTLPELATQQPAPPQPVERSDITAPVHETPVQRPAAKERHARMPSVEAPTRPPRLKKAARSDRIAKRPTIEDLNEGRKFGDNLRDIPVSSYAADGTQRTIVIRPTSIQDAYYYSAPR